MRALELNVRAQLVAGEPATLPAEQRGLRRDGVRLLVTDRARRAHEHRRFSELPRSLRTGDVVVANDSETVAAALRARQSDGTPLTVHVSGEIVDGVWLVEPRDPSGRGPSTTIAAGKRLLLPSGGRITFLGPRDPRRPRLWYVAAETGSALTAYLARYGEPVRYRYVAAPQPIGAYQTVFARTPGSAEMPSAGRPFTSETLRDLRRAGVQLATLTLHCGVASTEADEAPAPERFAVPATTAEAVNAARREGRRVIAIGTTVVRALESAVHDGRVVAASGWTEHVVDRAHPVRSVDGILTGLHDPAASHIAMLREFLDDDLLASAYAAARERGYLWHEFGDVHLVV